MKPKLNRAGDSAKSESYDRCQTPAYALAPLLPYLRPSWRIWEPASGEGYLADAIEDAGHTVTRSDLLTGTNFFTAEPPAYDVLITNPPYSVKYEWIERCYELGRPWALLMPVETLSAAKGIRLFERHGVEVTILEPRINFKMPDKGWVNSSAQFPVAWFSWRLTSQTLRFHHFIKPRQPRQSARSEVRP
jgi:hypothetical protein